MDYRFRIHFKENATANCGKSNCIDVFDVTKPEMDDRQTAFIRFCKEQYDNESYYGTVPINNILFIEPIAPKKQEMSYTSFCEFLKALNHNFVFNPNDWTLIPDIN